MRQKRQMDKLRFLTESRNGKESVIEKLIHKDNSSLNRISCRIAEKSDINGVMEVCFARQKWMTEQGLGIVVSKESRGYYSQEIEDRKLWVCKHSGVVMGFCVVEYHDVNGYWKDFPTDSFVYAHDGMTRPHKSVKETSDYNFIGILLNAIIDFYGKGIRFDVLLPNQRLESFYEKELGCNPVKKVIDEYDGSCHLLMEKTYTDISESFTRKIRSKKNDELTAKADTAFVTDGVYILHDTLGLKDVDGWNPKNNKGVVGILLIEDDHKIVVALEDSPENLTWSNEHGLINQPVDEFEDAESDFNGEYYCQKLNSPDFPAAYYCKTYNKGGRNWYLPSSGELRLIYNHLEEIQNAISIVGGQKLVTIWDDDVPVYWSSTEDSATNAWYLNLSGGYLHSCHSKVEHSSKVRPVSKFDFSTLKESFTKKISRKKNNELTTKADTAFVPDGVYILHETLGLKGVDGWNPKNNDGVVGILLIEDEHKIVVATEDAPEDLPWSEKRGLVNEPIKKKEDAKSDFNGEYYCRKLNSTDFPAAYYCKTYNKGGRSWYLPSSGELWLIYNHLEEIQNALSIVGGQKLITTWDEGVPVYWSSTEHCATFEWYLDLDIGDLYDWNNKVIDSAKVRPVSKFDFSILKESFTRKIRSKKNDELTTKADTAFVPDGVYILHETLGVRTVDGWNPKDNDGVVGILLIEDEHQIVIALEDSPKNLIWSEEYNFVNRPIKNSKTAKSEFNGEKYCRNLNSPDFPAAYYCLNYNKGGRDWYLPSMGELWLIRNHLEEIQTASSTVGRQRSVFTWDEFALPCFWSSTERDVWSAWVLNFGFRGTPDFWYDKVGKSFNVLPISKFQPSELKESFTKKISSKKNTDLISKPSFVLEDGVYILHETLGVRGVEGWNPKFNKGVVGVLVVEDEHQLVVALEDSPEELCWSKKDELVNEPIKKKEDAQNDFNGEYYCQKLDSPDFPAAYYCKTYNKGNRSWYLPSSGELWLIYNHLEEIQNALSIVGGQKFAKWDEVFVPVYWSSTESSVAYAWSLTLRKGSLYGWCDKVGDNLKVRPVSKFDFSTLKESFTRKIRSKKNDELISKPSFELDDGVYILHETLGVRTVDGWNPKDNEGVTGILLVEDEHKIVVALEDSPKMLRWYKKLGLINQPVKELEDAESDFNGEMYCRKLNSPDFPSAYYCKTYNKGGRSWYLPSSGELLMIYNHLDEIQNALSIVGGQKFATNWDEGVPVYWSSTEHCAEHAWVLYLTDGGIDYWDNKYIDSGKVRPISKFITSSLKESFTRKIRSKKNNELTTKADTAFVPDGVYILHETLGVRGVEGWNPKFNKGVVGILLIEDDHKIVVATEDAPEELKWSDKETLSQRELINEPIKEKEDAASDFNGEYYCRNLNSPDFPAAYYCSNYKKGGRKWHLPSSGELWLIYNHFEEIQNALKTVGGKKLVTTWNDNVPWYWSSSEHSDKEAWGLYFYLKSLECDFFFGIGKVRPVSNFNPSLLKESFIKKTKKSSNKDLVDIADKLASTNYDYNEENFIRKLRKETEQYYKSEFYKVYHYPLDYRYNGDIWPADEDGFHNMYLESTYWAERNEEVDFEGYCNDVTNNCAEPADVGVFVFGYGKDCVAYNEYGEYRKTHPLTESFTTKTKNKTVKDLQNKSDNVFNLDNLLREYVKSHCRPGSHNYDFYFAEENRPVFSDKEWKKLKGITVVKEIDDYYPSLHVVTPHGFTISDDFLPNTDDIFLFYVYKRRKFHIPVNRLPDKLSQELKEWVLNVNESFVRKSSSKSSSDMVSDTEDFDIELFIKDFILLHGRNRQESRKYFSHDLYMDDYRKEFFPFLGFNPYFVIVSDNYQNNQDDPIRKKIVDDKGNKIPYEISPGEVLVSYSDSNIVGWIPLRILPKEYKKKIYQTMKVLEK